MTTQVQVSATEEQKATWAEFIQASVHEVFGMMLNVNMSACGPEGFAYEVTSMVGLAGALCGLFTIRCSAETAGKLAGKMMGVDHVESQAEIHDALGEICNMLAGSFKSKIPGLSDGCMLSVPTTVTGSDYEVHPMRATPAFLDLFSKGDGCPIEVLLHVTR